MVSIQGLMLKAGGLSRRKHCEFEELLARPDKLFTPEPVLSSNFSCMAVSLCTQELVCRSRRAKHIEKKLICLLISNPEVQKANS